MSGWQFSLFDHVEGQVTFGDTKAGLLLTADSILLTALALGAERYVTADATGWTVAIAGAFLGGALLSVLVAILPARRHFVGGLNERSDHLTFSTIARRFNGMDSYVDSARKLAPYDLETEVLAAVYGKSVWARWKFAWLFVSVWCTIAAVVTAGVAVAVEFAAR